MPVNLSENKTVTEIMILYKNPLYIFTGGVKPNIQLYI